MTDPHTSTLCPAGQPLGRLHCRLDHAPLHASLLDPVDPLDFRRRRDLPHDPDAVQVLTDWAEPVGFLPADITAWLAPLLDAGRLALDLRLLPASPRADPPPHAPLLELQLHTTPAGHDILHPLHDAPARGDAHILHHVIAYLWQRVNDQRDPRLGPELVASLAPIDPHAFLPETRLLLALMAAPCFAAVDSHPPGSDAHTDYPARIIQASLAG